MNVQNQTASVDSVAMPPFDLALDEDEALVVNMVERFAAKHLGDEGSDPAVAWSVFQQLDLDELLSDFSDPVMITLAAEKLGYRCALGGLRLVLPHLLSAACPTETDANLCIAWPADGAIGVVGLLSGQDCAYFPLLLRRDSLSSFALCDLLEHTVTEQNAATRGFAILHGSLPYGRYREVDDQIPNAPAAAQRIALVLGGLLIGGMSRALDFGFEYAQTREAFGKAIIGHQPVSFRLVEGLLKLESLRLLLWREATSFPSDHGLKGLAEEIVDASATVLRDIMQNCGGHGYVAGTEIYTLFQTNSLCRALLASLSNSFLEYPSLEE